MEEEDSTSSCISTSSKPQFNVKDQSLAGPSSSSSTNLLRAFSNFKRSGIPYSIFRFVGGCWRNDIPAGVIARLRNAFAAGITVVESAIDGRDYIFDFLGMRMVDSVTGRSHCIGWTDVQGRDFFPRIAASSVWTGSVRLAEGSRCFDAVKRLFLAGFNGSDEAVVVSIHQGTSSYGRSRRRKEFKEFEERTKSVRGNANVKFGWYGATADEVKNIWEEGFSVMENRREEEDLPGLGFHFSEPLASNLSAMRAKAGKNNEQHLLLCRIILGKFEEVPAGSKQICPSSSEFESGVDDLENPKWYIIWGNNINSQVIVESIVTFRFKSSLQIPQVVPHIGRSASMKTSPKTTSMQKLFTEFAKVLPEKTMKELVNHFHLFKKGRVSKESLLKLIRTSVGDELLRSVVQRIR